MKSKPSVLIDSPVGPFSDPEAVERWVEHLKTRLAEVKTDEEIVAYQMALDDAEDLLVLSRRIRASTEFHRDG